MSSRTIHPSVATSPYESWMRLLASARPTRRNDETLTTFFLRECGGDPAIFATFLRIFKETLHSLPTAERVAVSQQYLRVVSLLCERFGLFAEKEDLDTTCFHEMDPKSFAKTEALLEKYKHRSRRTVADVIATLQELLKKKGHRVSIVGRYKHLYSINKKLVTKGYSSPLHLQDIFAFRIIVEKNDAQECFDILNLLHDRYMPVSERFKDYVSIPKVNGYQSIHTVLNGVLPDLDLPVEIQIRTRAMDEFAEHGLASHWLYSRSKRTQLLSVRERQLLEHYQSLSQDLSASGGLICCLTPAGDVLDLPEGSTVTDFAYRIHTELGNMAEGALVNGAKVGRDYRLRQADSVRVVTRSSPSTKHVKL